MSLALDPQTEQRIQQETARGNYRDPADLLNQALDALTADEQFFEVEKAALNTHLDHSMADVEAGRVYTSEDAARLR